MRITAANIRTLDGEDDVLVFFCSQRRVNNCVKRKSTKKYYGGVSFVRIPNISAVQKWHHHTACTRCGIAEMKIAAVAVMMAIHHCLINDIDVTSANSRINHDSIVDICVNIIDFNFIRV